MRYIVKKVDTGYEFTHIEERETLQGEKIEVLKGRNVIKKEDIEKNIVGLQEEIDKLNALLTPENIQARIEELKEQVEGDVHMMTDQLNTLKQFIEEINKLGE